MTKKFINRLLPLVGILLASALISLFYDTLPIVASCLAAILIFVLLAGINITNDVG